MLEQNFQGGKLGQCAVERDLSDCVFFYLFVLWTVPHLAVLCPLGDQRTSEYFLKAFSELLPLLWELWSLFSEPFPVD